MIIARVLGVPVPGLAVWKSIDDPSIAGDLEDAPEVVRPDDLVVLAVTRHGFRWHVDDLVEHRPDGGPARGRAPAVGRPRRRPHAHPARPPGTVLIAWLPFTREGDDAPGKHRPGVVLHSTDPSTIRIRPLYDAGSAHVRRHGGVRLEAWRAAGLDKPSMATDAVEVPVRHCEQTVGALSPSDHRRIVG